MVKRLFFVSGVQDVVAGFPISARRDLGHNLFLVQQGLKPHDFKYLGGVGSGVLELRYRDKSGAYRVVYVSKFPEGVYVLHAFVKKTQQTSKKDIAVVSDRYKQLMKVREEGNDSV